MKPDRRTLVIAAAIIAGAVLLSARQSQRPACAGGSCCPLPITLTAPTSNSFPVLTATNALPVQATTETPKLGCICNQVLHVRQAVVESR